MIALSFLSYSVSPPLSKLMLIVSVSKEHICYNCLFSVNTESITFSYSTLLAFSKYIWLTSYLSTFLASKSSKVSMSNWLYDLGYYFITALTLLYTWSWSKCANWLNDAVYLFRSFCASVSMSLTPWILTSFWILNSLNNSSTWILFAFYVITSSNLATMSQLLLNLAA